MHIAEHTPENLDHRFTQPEGWRWHNFTRAGRTIRFGSVFPKDSIPDAVVVCLQGLREFSEKYYETARWCLDQNLAFWIMDWAGQGYSTRYLKNPQKRHGHAFEEDIADLRYFILEYIKHSSVHPDKGRIPLALLGHSMGAHIGLRYILQHPETFECAAFSAPMIGIKAFRNISQKTALLAACGCKTFAGSCYVPGGADWDKRKEMARLSHDQQRGTVHNLWCAEDQNLQTGDVTFGWVYEAQKSCVALQKSLSKPGMIKKPTLCGFAGHEDLVDNALAQKLLEREPMVKTLDYPESYHEILMEKDYIRDHFLEAFYALIKETIIDKPETLKPF